MTTKAMTGRRESLVIPLHKNSGGVAIQRFEMDDLAVLESIISCPVCMEIYTDPRVLTCQHVFCERCLNKYILSLRKETSTVSNERKFACPTCRQPNSVPTDTLTLKLPKAFYINSVIEYYTKMKGPGIVKPSAPPEEPEMPKVKNRRVSHQLTAEQYAKLTTCLSSNPQDCYEKAREFITSQDASRFGPSVKELKRNSQSPSSFYNDTNEFERECEIANLKVHLENNKNYSSLNDNQGLCQLRQNSNKLLDMYITKPKDSDAIRVLITYNKNSNEIWFHYKKINLTSDSLNKRVNLDGRITLSGENIPPLEVYLHLKDYKINEVLYLRYFNKRIFLTCHCTQNDKAEKIGLVVSYEVDEENLLKHDSDEILKNPIISNPMRLDRTSKSNVDIIAGLDIDRVSKELYCVSPANGSIYRLDLATLKPNDNEWIIRDFQMEYVAYNPQDNEIWATCPEQDKVIIMDRNTGKYQESETRSTLGIDLSQIICTTDNRIVGLDRNSGQIHWLKAKDNFLFSQAIEQSSYFSKSTANLTRSIQPMEDLDYAMTEKDNSRHPLIGGIICTSQQFSYLIYPKSSLTRTGGKPMFSSLFKLLTGSS